MAVKVALFDLDGVLTETSEQHYEAWKALADELGIKIDYEFNETLKGISRMESLERILSHGGKQNNFSMDEKITLANKKNNLYVKMIEKLSKENLFQGVEELLKILKENNIKIGLASASKNGPKILRLLEIENYFDCIVDPSSVANGKPAPDIFLKGAEILGAKPEECIGFEDSLAGIEAIKTAGMYAIGVGDENILTKADKVFKTVDKINIREILKGLQ